MKKVFVLDQDPSIAEWFSISYEHNTFAQLTTFNNPYEAIHIGAVETPDFFIIDLNLSDLDGIEVCRKLRQYPQFATTGIILTSNRYDDFAVVAALDAGADDFLIKPFNPLILIQKLTAIGSRYQKLKSADLIENSALIPTDNTSFVVINGIQYELAKKELSILQLLLSKPERVFTRNEIYAAIWGSDNTVGERTIDVHIRKLRTKIGEEMVRTVNGIGYKFVPMAG
jgi:two-component system, OmpR family, alkaline phosphatase synthesis response regulator PhoP